ncbi:MAG: macrolide ABC transporter ATP-binding protein [Parcubacteria group bacterium CG1_02_40_25]|nr:MAG: macrolide ABC transporter ATP-binding protein [Parcubacteria group bacterium CG1_02_40_25]
MPLIQVKNLIKIYQDDGIKTQALSGVSFNIDQGEFVGVMGASGSGKSTLLHVLGFLDKPTSGKYYFANKEMGDYSEDEINFLRNQEIGFIFQAFNLLARTTVLENVKLPLLYSSIKKSLWDAMAKQAINQVGLEHRLNHESSQLSGGEKQRVAIARALISNPKVIFADEPTGNLDSKSGTQIMEILKTLNQNGQTIILITHNDDAAKYAKRIIRLKDGKIESDKRR